jgi:y4mF family transcriptional regulator
MTEKPLKPIALDLLKSKQYSSANSPLADITKSVPQNFGLEPEATSGLNKLLKSTYTSMAENIAKSSLESYQLKPDMASGLNKLLSSTHTSIAEKLAKNSLESYRLQPDMASGLNRLLSSTHTSIAEKLAQNSLESYRLKPGMAAGLNKSKGSPPAVPIDRVSITVPTQLGLLIKSSRTSKKLTQQQLADLAGVGRRFIVECEAGKPRLEFAKVLQVAAAAGIDIFAIKR